MRLLICGFLTIFLFNHANSQEQSVKTPSEKKPYFIRLTIDALRLGADSASYNHPKTYYFESGSKSDTFDIGAVNGTSIGISFEIQKFLVEKKVRYRFSYTYYKKVNDKWELIKNFGWVDRFSLLKKPGEVNDRPVKPAREEFYCSIGEPMQFSARFRMDIYLNQ